MSNYTLKELYYYKKTLYKYCKKQYEEYLKYLKRCAEKSELTLKPK